MSQSSWNTHKVGGNIWNKKFSLLTKIRRRLEEEDLENLIILEHLIWNLEQVNLWEFGSKSARFGVLRVCLQVCCLPSEGVPLYLWFWQIIFSQWIFNQWWINSMNLNSNLLHIGLHIFAMAPLFIYSRLRRIFYMWLSESNRFDHHGCTQSWLRNWKFTL